MELDDADAAVSAIASPPLSNTSNGPEDHIEEEEKPALPSESQENEESAQLVSQWRDRSNRLEALLRKQKTRTNELEQTETKLKRLLAMAKRSIDNSKQEIVEKDETITNLKSKITSLQETSTSSGTRPPKRIILKVSVYNKIWCFVEFAVDSEDEEVEENTTGWVVFHTEEEVQRYAETSGGEPVVIPDYSLAPRQVQKQKQTVEEELQRVQEEFRRYRVRAEITRKQKDAELKKLSTNAVQKQTEQLGETDVQSELQSSKAQIRRLMKAQSDAEEREEDWRRKFEKLRKDYEKLSGTMGETVLATEWRERYEQLAQEKAELERQVKPMMPTLGRRRSNSNGASSPNSELQSLKNEFAQYREKAMQAVEEKEKELKEVQNHGSAGMRRRSSSNTSLGGLEMSTSNSKQTEYLKNIVLKYMTSEVEEAKEPMEKAIATVLNFSPAEVKLVEEKRKQQGWFW